MWHRSSTLYSDYLEEWDGEGGGGRFRREGTFLYLWLIHVDVWQKPTQYCKVIILRFKKKEYSWFHHAEETTGNTLEYIFSLFLCRNIFIFLKSTVVTSMWFFNLLFYPIIYFEHHFKLIHFWTSLAFGPLAKVNTLLVHWLRLHAPDAGGLGLIPGLRTRSHVPQLRPSTARRINI